MDWFLSIFQDNRTTPKVNFSGHATSLFAYCEWGCYEGGRVYSLRELCGIIMVVKAKKNLMKKRMEIKALVLTPGCVTVVVEHVLAVF